MGYKYVFMEVRSMLSSTSFHNCWRWLTPSSWEVVWEALEQDTAVAELLLRTSFLIYVFLIPFFLSTIFLPVFI